MAHNAVARITEKAWTAGFGSDKSKGNYHVGMDLLELNITWKEYMRPELIPYIDDQGHQGLKIRITKINNK